MAETISMQHMMPSSASFSPQEMLSFLSASGTIDLSRVRNEMIKTPIHKLTRSIVGNMYDPKTEKPYKGSILYTITKIFVCFAVSMFLFGIINIYQVCVAQLGKARATLSNLTLKI